MDTNTVVTTEKAQPVSLTDIKRKTEFTGTVIKTTLAGAVVDIGLDVPGVIHISQLQEKPTNRVEDVVDIGQTVEVWVKRIDPRKGRIELTMIEPLALEWREIKRGMVVSGKVTRLEKFGAFVDIGAERPGLVHISEMTHDYIKSPQDVVHEGDDIEVQILDVNRRKRQIKLSMKALEEKPAAVEKPVPKSKEKKPPEQPKDVLIPTAMEVAMREAMEKSKDLEEDQSIENSSSITSKDELDEILTRTLEKKVQTTK